MRVLLPQSIFYVPTIGGENISNRAWLEQLAHAGHTCRVVAPAFGPQGPRDHAEYRRTLNRLGICPKNTCAGADVYRFNGVEVHAVTERVRLPSHVRLQIRQFDPTWVLVASLDPGQLLLEVCAQACPARVIYLAHTPQHFPFGPSSVAPNPRATDLLQQVCAIVAIGQQTAQYVRRYTQREPAVIHPPVYGAGPFPRYGSFDDGYISMINPSSVKGISIFRSLAAQFPVRKFGALVGWATTDADRALLTEIPNVEVWEPVENIDQVLGKTRILLVPSLYREGFGLVVVEAMLRGIPVLASHYGGLVDAKLGLDYLLPVRVIEGYRKCFDDRGFPVSVVPDQVIDPWADALSKLTSDRTHYEQVSLRSRRAALKFVAAAGKMAFAKFLSDLAAPTDRRSGHGRTPITLTPAAKTQLATCVDSLSRAKRAVLLERLRRKQHATGDANDR